MLHTNGKTGCAQTDNLCNKLYNDYALTLEKILKKYGYYVLKNKQWKTAKHSRKKGTRNQRSQMYGRNLLHCFIKNMAMEILYLIRHH